MVSFYAHYKFGNAKDEKLQKSQKNHLKYTQLDQGWKWILRK
jgi:hypothetical protein